MSDGTGTVSHSIAAFAEIFSSLQGFFFLPCFVSILAHVLVLYHCTQTSQTTIHHQTISSSTMHILPPFHILLLLLFLLKGTDGTYPQHQQQPEHTYGNIIRKSLWNERKWFIVWFCVDVKSSVLPARFKFAYFRPDCVRSRSRAHSTHTSMHIVRVHPSLHNILWVLQ